MFFWRHLVSTKTSGCRVIENVVKSVDRLLVRAVCWLKVPDELLERQTTQLELHITQRPG